jgi:hypothetical protein
MINLKWTGLLVMLPAIAAAGSISIGSSASTLTFNPPSVTLGTCASNVCTISGSGSLSGAPLHWSIVTTLSGGNAIQESGTGPMYSINQEGATIAFSLSDTPGADSLLGTVQLTSATDSFSPDLTDITGVITYTSVNLVTPALEAYLTTHYGTLPSVNSTSLLDLTITCGTTTECIPFAGDPAGTVQSASIMPNNSSATPEPGSLALIGTGFAGLIYRLRRRR